MNDVICIDTSRFSKQRQLVMGIAALMIYFAHAYAIVPVDGVIAKLLSLGNLGVDIFLFASGFGMYYSLRNGGGAVSLRQFYWKRFVRVGVPFLLISVPVYLLLDMLISREGGGAFLLDISTLSYWVEHDGAWYVSAMLPVYALTPILPSLLNDDPKRCLWLIIFLVFGGFILNSCDVFVLNNIGFVISRLPSYVLGWCIGQYSYEGRKFSVKGYQLVAALLTSVVVWRLGAKMGLDLSFLLMPVLSLPIPLNCASLKLLGDSSLESYLLNIYGLLFIKELALPFAGGFAYLSFSIACIAFSLVLHRANAFVAKCLIC